MSVSTQSKRQCFRAIVSAIQAMHVLYTFAVKEEEDCLQSCLLYLASLCYPITLCLLATLQKQYKPYMHLAKVTLNDQIVLS